MKPEWTINDPYVSIEYVYPTIASGVAYGITLCLSVTCIRALWKGRQYTKQRKWSLYLYIVLGLALSTISLAEDIFIVKAGINNLLDIVYGRPIQDYTFSTSSITIAFDYDWAMAPFAIWAADGFMVSKRYAVIFKMMRAM